MPITVRWEPKGAYYKPTGIITADEVMRAQKMVLHPPEGIEPIYQIIDAREAERFELDQMQLFNVSADDLAVGRKFPKLKVAFIATNKDVEKTFLNHIKNSWAMNTQSELRLFTSLKSARDWIGVPFPEKTENPSPTKKKLSDFLKLPEEND